MDTALVARRCPHGPRCQIYRGPPLSRLNQEPSTEQTGTLLEEQLLQRVVPHSYTSSGLKLDRVLKFQRKFRMTFTRG